MRGGWRRVGRRGCPGGGKGGTDAGVGRVGEQHGRTVRIDLVEGVDQQRQVVAAEVA
jgi:hypothetical protein